MNLLRRHRSSQTKKKWWVGEESYYCESVVDSNSVFSESIFLAWCKIIWSDPARSGPANPWLFRAPEICEAAILDCRVLHGTFGVLWENVFESVLAREGPSSAVFENSRHLASSSCGLGQATAGNIMAHGRGGMRVPQSSTIPTPRFHQGVATHPIQSYWRNLFSQCFDGFPESSRSTEMKSWKIPWFIGISKLESQLQDWSMFKISIPSSQDVLDQRSRDSKVNRRPYDVTIDKGANRFHRLRYAWCDDCVCIEEASHECALPENSKCRRATCSKKTTDSYEEDSKSIDWSNSQGEELVMQWVGNAKQSFSGKPCKKLSRHWWITKYLLYQKLRETQTIENWELKNFLQHMVQIQELQDKVSSLKEAKEFYDREPRSQSTLENSETQTND